MEEPVKPHTPSFATGTRLFVCVLAAAHAITFASYWVQADGLVGPAGILPAGQYFEAVRAQLGWKAYYDVPSLCWLFGAGAFIKILCGAGIALSVLLFLGYAPAICLALLWASYLSLVSAGQVFFDFQWDTLLLETTLVAIFVVPWSLRPLQAPRDPPKLARALVWWLLFRLMFFSGLVKLTNGDPTWRNLTALTLHYETQPLPTPVAWYAHHLPMAFQVFSCVVMFVIELGAPLFLVAPRRLRHWAAVALIFLQVVIALTGNYAFFNLLTVGLCLTCLDDEWWRGIHWGVTEEASPERAPSTKRRLKATAVRWFAALYAGVTFFETFASLSPGAAGSPIVRAVEEVVGPTLSFNNYGLFRVMTPERDELVFEGSNDARDWRAYEFPYKPGDLARRPKWAAPYQPRLDWQLWFAVLDPGSYRPFVETVCERLLKGDAAVLGLLSHNPFPAQPPRYVRVIRYHYEFTTAEERARTGNWWRRTPLDFYIPGVTLPPQK